MTVKLKLTGLSVFSSPACRVRGVSATVAKNDTALFSDELGALLLKGGRSSGAENIWVPNWTEVKDDLPAKFDFSELEVPKRKLSRMEELAIANKARAEGNTPPDDGEDGGEDGDPADQGAGQTAQPDQTATTQEPEAVVAPEAEQPAAPAAPVAKAAKTAKVVQRRTSKQ